MNDRLVGILFWLSCYFLLFWFGLGVATCCD